MRIARVLLVLTSATIVVAAVGGWLLIPVVFGHNYADSVGPFLWLLPGTIGYLFLRVFSSSLLASGSPARSSLGSAAALVTGVCFDFVLIPIYGAPGAAIAATLAFFVGGLVATTAHRRAVGYVWRDLVPRRSDMRFIVGLFRRVAGRAEPDE